MKTNSEEMRVVIRNIWGNTKRYWMMYGEILGMYERYRDVRDDNEILGLHVPPRGDRCTKLGMPKNI